MENYDRYVEIQEAAMDSEDASILQYSKTLDSLQSKLNQISNSFQQFYMSIANGPTVGGVLDFLNTLISGFSKLGTVTGIASLVNIINGIKMLASLIVGQLSPAISKLLLTYKNSKTAFVQAGQEIGKETGDAQAAAQTSAYQAGVNKSVNSRPVIVSGATGPGRVVMPNGSNGGNTGTSSLLALPGGNTSPKKAINTSKIGGIGTLVGAGLTTVGTLVAGNGNAVAGAALSGLGNTVSYAAMGLMSAGPAGAAVGGLVGILTSLPGVISAINNQLQEEVDKLKTKTEESNIERVEAKTEADDLANYIEKYDELKKHRYDSVDAMQEYLDISNEIAENYPQYISYIDESGNAILDMSNAATDLTTNLELAAAKTLEWSINARKAAQKEAELAVQNLGSDNSFITNEGDVLFPTWRWDGVWGARTGVTEFAGRYYQTDLAVISASLKDVLQATKDAANNIDYSENSLVSDFLESVNQLSWLGLKWTYEGNKNADMNTRLETLLSQFGLETLSDYNTLLETLNTVINTSETGSKESQAALVMRSLLVTTGRGYMGDNFVDPNTYTLGSEWADVASTQQAVLDAYKETGSQSFTVGYNKWANKVGKNSQAAQLASDYGLKSIISYQALNDEQLEENAFLIDLSNGTYMEEQYEIFSTLIENMATGSKTILQQFADDASSVSMEDIQSLVADTSKQRLSEEQKAALQTIYEMWQSNVGDIYESLASHFIGEDFLSYDDWIKEKGNAGKTYDEYWKQYSDVYSKIASLAPSLATKLTTELTKIDETLDTEGKGENYTKTSGYKIAEARKQLIANLLDSNTGIGKILAQITDPTEQLAVWNAILADQSLDYQNNVKYALKEANVTEADIESFTNDTNFVNASFVNLNTALNDYYNSLVDKNDAIVDLLQNGSKGISIDSAKKKWSELGIADMKFSEAFYYDEELQGVALTDDGLARIRREVTEKAADYRKQLEQATSIWSDFQESSTLYDNINDTDSVDLILTSLGVDENSALATYLKDAAINAEENNTSAKQAVYDALKTLVENSDPIMQQYYEDYILSYADELERAQKTKKIQNKISKNKDYTDAFEDELIQKAQKTDLLKTDDDGNYTADSYKAALQKLGYHYNTATGEITRDQTNRAREIARLILNKQTDTDEYRALASEYESASSSIVNSILDFSGPISAEELEQLQEWGITGYDQKTVWTNQTKQELLKKLADVNNPKITQADYDAGMGQIQQDIMTFADVRDEAVESLFSDFGSTKLQDVLDFVKKIDSTKELSAEQTKDLQKALAQGGAALWDYLVNTLKLDIGDAKTIYTASLQSGKAEAKNSIIGLYDTFLDNSLSFEEKLTSILKVFEDLGGFAGSFDYEALEEAIKNQDWGAIIAALIKRLQDKYNDVIDTTDVSDIATKFKESLVNTLSSISDKIINAYQSVGQGKTVTAAIQELKDLELENEIDFGEAYTWRDSAEGVIATPALLHKISEKWEKEYQDYTKSPSQRLLEKYNIEELGPEQYALSDNTTGKLVGLNENNYQKVLLESLGIALSDEQSKELAGKVQGQSNVDLFNTVVSYLTEIGATYNNAIANMLKQQSEYWETQAELAASVYDVSSAATQRQTAIEGYSSIYDTKFVSYAQDNNHLAKLGEQEESYTDQQLTQAAEDAGYIVNEITGEMLSTPTSILQGYKDAYKDTLDEGGELPAEIQAQCDSDIAAWRQSWVETLSGYTGIITEEQISNLAKYGFDITGLKAGERWTNDIMQGIVQQGENKQYFTSDNAKDINGVQALANSEYDLLRFRREVTKSFFENYTDKTISDVQELYQTLLNNPDAKLSTEQIAAAEKALKGGWDEFSEFLKAPETEGGLGLSVDKSVINQIRNENLADTLESLGDLGDSLGDTDLTEAEKISDVLELFEEVGATDISPDTIKTWLAEGGNFDTLFAELGQQMRDFYGEAFNIDDFNRMKTRTLAQIRDQTIEDNADISEVFSQALSGTLSNVDFQNIIVSKLGGKNIHAQQTAEGVQLSNDDVLKLAASWVAQKPLQANTVISGLQENGLLDDYAEVKVLIKELTAGTGKWGDATAEVLALVQQVKTAMEQDTSNMALDGDILGATDDKFDDFVSKVSNYSNILTSVNKNQKISFDSAKQLIGLMAQHEGIDQTSEKFQGWLNNLTALLDFTDGGTVQFSSFLDSIGMSMGEFNDTCIDEIRTFAENRISYLDGMIALLEGLQALSEGLSDTEIKWPEIDFSDAATQEEAYNEFITKLNDSLELQKQLFNGKTWAEMFPDSGIDFGTFMANMGGLNASNFNETAYKEYQDFFTSDEFKQVNPELYVNAGGALDSAGWGQAYADAFATYLQRRKKEDSALEINPSDYGTPNIAAAETDTTQIEVELNPDKAREQLQSLKQEIAASEAPKLSVDALMSLAENTFAQWKSDVESGKAVVTDIDGDPEQAIAAYNEWKASIEDGTPTQAQIDALTTLAENSITAWSEGLAAKTPSETGAEIQIGASVDEDSKTNVANFRADAEKKLEANLSISPDEAETTITQLRENIANDTTTKQAIGADFSAFDLAYEPWKNGILADDTVKIPLNGDPANAEDAIREVKDTAESTNIQLGADVKEEDKKAIAQWKIDETTGLLTITFNAGITPTSIEEINTLLADYAAERKINYGITWGTDEATIVLQQWLDGLATGSLVIPVILVPTEESIDEGAIIDGESATASVTADISEAEEQIVVLEGDIASGKWEVPITSNTEKAIEQAEAAAEKINNMNVVLPVTAQVIGHTINSSYGTGLGGGDIHGIIGKKNNLSQMNAKVTGNAYVEGTTSLVGELGPELAVYDGQYHLLGQHGAEFVDLPGNAVVFNHKQTEGIMQGRPGVRGKVLNGGEAFVTGTGPAYDIGSAIDALKAERNLWQGVLAQLSFEELIGSGGGGGGGNTLTATIQELTEWYNLTRQIRDLEIQINNLEAERENITDGHKYLRNLRETQELLQAQMITQKTLLDYQEKQLDQQKEQINENEIWNKFFTVDDDGLLQYVMGNETNGGKGTLSVLDQMNKMSGEEQVAFLKKIGYTYTDNDGKEYKDAELVQKFYEEAQTQIDKYDDLRDTVAETTETLEDLEGEINSINEEIRENQETLEQDVYDALVNKMETEIEDLTDQMELLKEANDAYINGLSDALQKERDLYSENQSTADREQLQRELSLLRRSGGSASKIASLEEQLDSTLQDEYFTHQQDTIDSIQEASDKQVEALNKQIELQQESLDYQKEAGVLWTKVYEIMAQNEEEIMDFLRGNSEGFYEKSQLAQEDALKEWSKEVGIYKEDSIWGQEFNSEEATKNFDSEAWNDSNFGTAKQAIYNALTADRQEDIKTHFATAYANAKTAGQTDEEAYDTAREAIYERLYASYSEQADAAGTADSDRLVTGSDSGKGWVQVQYGPGLGGTSAVAVGSSGHWYYTTDELKAQKPHVTFSTPTLKDKKGNKITNKGKISLNQKGGFTGVTRGTVKIFIGTSSSEKTQAHKEIADSAAAAAAAGATADSIGVQRNDDTTLKKRRLTAATGALIEEDGTPAILHKGEGVFTAKQTSALISMVDNYQKLATNAMGATLLSSFAGTAKNYSSLSAAPSNQTSSITIDPGAVVIQVEKLNDKYDVDSLATDVFNKITAIASKATNRGVNRR